MPSEKNRMRPSLGLSGRVFVLTVLFVTFAEILIYIPALSYYRRTQLTDRIAAAQIAAIVLDTPAGTGLTPDMEMKVLDGVGVKFMAFGAKGVRNLMADGPINPQIDRIADLRDKTWPHQLRDTFDDLLFGTEGNVRVFGHAPGLDFVEILMRREVLRADLIAFSRLFLGYSLFISLVSALLLYGALRWLIVTPVLKLAHNVAYFAEQPADVSRIITPSGRGDEIGQIEQALAGMEGSLAEELRKKRRLAELGLAVSKINHELRNILTSAQLLTDRLDGSPDQAVQRIAPRLVTVLGRAIAFCEATLAYGRVQETPPQRQVIPVRDLLEDIEDHVGLSPQEGIAIERDVPAGVTIDADQEQLSRVLINLIRNSVQALQNSPATENACIRIVAREEGGETVILISDNGPGIPDAMKAKLFTPFHGDRSKASAGSGSGLGLVIAAELVAAHGGTLSLKDSISGAVFQIAIPERRP